VVSDRKLDLDGTFERLNIENYKFSVLYKRQEKQKEKE